VGWWLLLALGVSSWTPGGVWAQAPTEVLLPVGTVGTVPNPFGLQVKKIEVVPPIAQAQLSFDTKTIEINALTPGFAQVRVFDAANNVLQVINVQILPPDLDLPYGDTKVFPASPGAIIKEVRTTVPDIVKAVVSPDKKQAEVTGVNLGSTKLTIIDDKGNYQVFNIVVVVSEKYIRDKIRAAVPMATVYPVQLNKGVFMLNGTVERAEDIPAVLEASKAMGVIIINQLHVPGVMQVQLDVVIAEVTRSELRQMRFDFFDAGQHHVFTSTFNHEAGPLTELTTALVHPAATTSALGADANLVLGFVNNKQSFFGFLNALRTEGLAKFLACPKLVTLSGKPATFLSGGKLAVPEPSGLGTNAVTFVNFGTQLSFLPIVLGNGKIFIEVEPKVDIINAANGTTIAGTTVPGFDSQHLHASVEMEAGQTFAIGGLIQHEVAATTVKVPVAGDLPFIGTLFRSVQHDQIETELIILVTPYLVDPMACDQLPKYVPGQETRIPDDFELFLEGVIEAPRGQRAIFPDGIHYKAPYWSSPSAAIYPCGVPSHGHNGNGNGSCGNGSCGNGNGDCHGPDSFNGYGPGSFNGHGPDSFNGNGPGGYISPGPGGYISPGPGGYISPGPGGYISPGPGGYNGPSNGSLPPTSAKPAAQPVVPVVTPATSMPRPVPEPVGFSDAVGQSQDADRPLPTGPGYYNPGNGPHQFIPPGGDN
jgi:pilus assembly protein CpaC